MIQEKTRSQIFFNPPILLMELSPRERAEACLGHLAKLVAGLGSLLIFSLLVQHSLNFTKMYFPFGFLFCFQADE